VYLEHAAEAVHQGPVLRADVEVCEGRLRLVPSRRLGGWRGRQGVPWLGQDAMGRVSSCAWPQTPIT